MNREHQASNQPLKWSWSNTSPPDGFIPVCQLPCAYRIHQFIKAYIPRQLARVVATVWVSLTVALCATLSIVLNVCFIGFWWLFRVFLPRQFFYFVLEFGTATVMSSCAHLMLVLNSFTWPIFEYRGSIQQQSANASFNCSSPCSDSAQSDGSSTVDSSSSLPLSPCDPSPLSELRCRRPSLMANPDSMNSSHSTMSSETMSPSCTGILHSDKCSDFTPTASASPAPPADCAKFTPRKTVVMVNHLSLADGLLFAGLSVGWGVKFIYKQDANRVPLLGACLITARHIALHFTSAKGGWGVEKSVVSKMMERVSELVKLPIPILVFPEGTRRRFNRMSPFRQGFFRFCIEYNVEAYPSVVYGTQHCWPVGSFLVDFHEIYVVYGKQSIQPAEYTVETLISTVRNKMVEMLKLCPGYDHETERPIESFEEFERLEREAEQLSFF